MKRFLGLVLAVAVAWPAVGCRPKKTEKEAAPTSRVEAFKQQQAATTMAHGKIRLDTVEEAADGRIKYQTEDGKTWLVEMKPDEKGYTYGTPEEVK
jgi:hypothetical protein